MGASRPFHDLWDGTFFVRVHHTGTRVPGCGKDIYSLGERAQSREPTVVFPRACVFLFPNHLKMSMILAGSVHTRQSEVSDFAESEAEASSRNYLNHTLSRTLHELVQLCEQVPFTRLFLILVPDLYFSP
jgi:hypothetical protein